MFNLPIFDWNDLDGLVYFKRVLLARNVHLFLRFVLSKNYNNDDDNNIWLIKMDVKNFGKKFTIFYLYNQITIVSLAHLHFLWFANG